MNDINAGRVKVGLGTMNSTNFTGLDDVVTFCSQPQPDDRKTMEKAVRALSGVAAIAKGTAALNVSKARHKNWSIWHA